ncbi:erythromycin esterase family protein [Geodermatophilus poikilotrophus]|uniref:Erythromycin esterase n=1 Tax=Geodermatophilus poikilotrophus TaxID=1333667 RepID=A0A1I0DWE1_9ACTN|nr:erythromycin esterase family protein [Geodermatophilus poikilotrophus]SET36818.1 erythromycin esterase [Geodermatophilus poikilotrophus]
MPEEEGDREAVDQVRGAVRGPAADGALPLPPAAVTSDLLAVGEATHGSSEFFRTRAAFVRQMVEDHGTRLVALEASAAATVALDRVVGRGSTEAQIVDVLGGLGYWTWNVREMLELLAWIASWNARHRGPDTVRVVGVDPNGAGSALVRLRSAPFGDRDAVAALDRLDPLAERDGRLLVEDRDLLGVVEAATGFQQALLAHEHGAGSAGAASRDEPVRAALLDCCILLAGLEQEADARRRGLHPGAREGLRDQRMADLLTLHRAADGRGSGPVLLLAHNVHISRELPGDARYRPLGAVLADELGDRYYALAQFFGRGEFLAKSAIASSLQRRPRRRRVTLMAGLPLVEHVLDQIDGTAYVLDLRGDAGPAAQVLSEHSAMRAFGAQVVPVVYRTSMTHIDPGRAYDGIVYHREIGSSTLLPRPPRGAAWCRRERATSWKECAR